MNDLSSVRHFRLRRGCVDCDAEGVRVGRLELLVRDVAGRWTPRAESEILHDLAEIYGHTINLRSKRRGLETIAAALDRGEIARAQIATLLLQFPDPPALGCASVGEVERQRLARDLVASGLLKVDDDWEEQHPRTRSPPNPGWFAPKPKPQGTPETPKADPNAGDRASVEPAAYNSGLHDEIRDRLLADLNAAGNTCFKEVNLDFNGINIYIDILCKNRFGALSGIEVKTGDTDYTANQKVVYPHAVVGAGVISTDQRITELGFSPGELLPAFDIDLVYAAGAGQEIKWYSLRDLMSRGVQ